MISLYRSEEAQATLAEFGAEHGEDLALRVYTSRLLGSDSRLVLHGGGNTSVKSQALEVTGQKVDVIYVKGSGGNLATLGPKGFPAVRLAPLKALATLPSLSDEQMTRELRGQCLDWSRPSPSVETLVHVLIPGKFVDHSHSDALLALTNQPNGKDRILDLYGDSVLIVPYAMPGFALAKMFAKTWEERLNTKSAPSLVVLDKHGIFTWGETAQESYERMIEAVSKAEDVLRRDSAPGSGGRHRLVWTAREYQQNAEADGEGDKDHHRATIGTLVRGELRRRSDLPWICAWRTSDVVLEAISREDILPLLQKGCATPDHVIRAKPWPLVTGNLPLSDTPALRTALAASIDDYVARYEAYFERNKAARAALETAGNSAASGSGTRSEELIAIDPFPRVLLIPGLGALTLGTTRKNADIAADIVQHTAAIVLDAASTGTFEPASENNLFDLEYWSLEQAKLTKNEDGSVRSKGDNSPFGLGFNGKVVLVTGAASGIGFATARMFLNGGAHIVFTDRDQAMLNAVVPPLAQAHPGQVLSLALDVTSYEECEQVFRKTLLRFGGIDIVVSNAGSASEGKLHTEQGDKALRNSIELNLLGHQNVVRAAANAMITQGTAGALLFNASKSAFNQGPDFGPYAVPKTALLALMRQYAIDLAPYGIRTGAVNADRIRTALFTPSFVEARAKARNVGVDEYFKANLLRRETTADDVAEAFVYLALAGATTGCVITVDGGNAAAFPR